MTFIKNLSGAFLLLFISSLFITSCEKESLTVSPDTTWNNGDLIETQSALLLGPGDNSTLGNPGDCVLLNPSPTINQEEIDLLKHMREEEKLARDVYIAMYETYNVNIFNNISKSEQVHMDRILCLLDYYEIADPASVDIGVFNNPDLQALYDLLITQGSVSLLDAYIVGATIEDVDIYDLLEYVNKTENPAIITILENLTCGSYNHLRAFMTMVDNADGSYSAQYITQDEFELILNSEMPGCNNGTNKGNKKGKGTNNGSNGAGTCTGNGNGNGSTGNGTCTGTGTHGDGTCTGTGGNTGGKGNGKKGNGNKP